MQPFTKLACLSLVGPMKGPVEGETRIDLKEKQDPWGTQR